MLFNNIQTFSFKNININNLNKIKKETENSNSNYSLNSINSNKIQTNLFTRPNWSI
ncbi:hypothetical protein DDB_G0289989 [Dictyostelium discoideum AX4]|uniref:Putative uncharacterized protein DDB_G0289989 n=1 Tax=Dictyostelium discoideum TaxID=44689 RepID=Y8672_DICDI|nr:hypothetical protein DDB_G0289989 [Dictyostelium discoideum AX4]Q54GQ8.1 RecName: Full=Putative uncharacterized protein DDB_G0289989 [Dictyostelium discoideum]EAL62440.1 hypothetical protein DDB_G0289989 [Dictyostelium discoideum AX4]|eukprot:XP_635944.1 hypothetical protein DDB_G0289989 [Dictyostelium discoideum AX4]